MTPLLAAIVGCLYAAGTFMLLRRSLFKLILGLVLVSHASNLLIFISGGLTRAQPAIAPEGAMMPVANAADPVPQALILTAIVIGFSVVAFALVLFHRGYQTLGTDDPDDLKATDR
jgi:multicomponent Na+:H+ antiporter subunit C